MTLQEIMQAHDSNAARVVACALELDTLPPDDLARDDLRAAMQSFASLEVAEQLAEQLRWLKAQPR